MKLEKLERNKRKNIVIGVVVFLCFISAIMFMGSRAKYKVTQSIPLVNGTINYKPYDFKMMAMYQANGSGGYTEIDSMPTSGYEINEEKSYCTTDNVNKDTTAKLYTDDRGKHVFENLKKNDKCYIWFDKGILKMTISEMVASHNPTKGAASFIGVSTTDEGLLSGTDDDGTTYYFRGNVINNWVQFAGFYWRIIRINGDGSIRLIYNGKSTDQIGEATHIGTNIFNSLANSAEYVGIKYTMGSQHGTGTNSTVLGTSDSTDTTTLNGWYNSKIKATNYEKYVDINGKFCSNRNVASGHSNFTGTTGTGTSKTMFVIGDRFRTENNSTWETTQIPTFKCSTLEDILKLPVGLITADEVVFAGGFGGSKNQDYYLYTGQSYWTMSPWYYAGSKAYVFDVSAYGAMGSGIYVDYTALNTKVRPVINLSSNVTLTGSGTTSDPYKVV